MHVMRWSTYACNLTCYNGNRTVREGRGGGVMSVFCLYDLNSPELDSYNYCRVSVSDGSDGDHLATLHICGCVLATQYTKL